MLPQRIAVLVNTDFEASVGPSGERPAGYEADAAVLDTARAVREALTELGIASDPIEVRESTEGLLPALRRGGYDCAFNLVESIAGDYGREWEVPALLADSGIAFTGNGARALRVCCKKDEVRALLASAGVRVGRGLAVHGAGELDALAALQALPFPAFVKPARVDGSIGIDASSKVDSLDALRARVLALQAAKLPPPYLIEQYLPGKEINASVIPDGSRDQVAITEIDFSAVPANLPRFVTYEGKWNPESDEYASRSVPAQLEPALREEVERLARAAFAALSLRSYGRIDMRLDDEGHPTVIDVNPNCDIHPDAGIAVTARHAGVSYPELIRRVVLRALEGRDAAARD